MKNSWREMYEKVLPLVQTPAQYLGGELNSVVKDAAGVRLHWCLCFPDTYALGMSHLGLKILYHILNERQEVWAERCFAPWPDMESQLRRHCLPLCSLESHTPLRAFDVLGFSLSYELCGTGVLQMLELGGVPLRASERAAKDPLVIAGGQCCANPEPWADFFDLFAIGDGEELVVELSQTLLETEGAPRQERLEELARRVPGLYVPSLYRPAFRDDGALACLEPRRDWAPLPVVRRFVADLEAAPFPTKPVVPFVETAHERYAIEIMRGCAGGCRFCQAGFITRPRRSRSAETILRLAEEGYRNTGYEEIGLLALSASDHPQIREITHSLNERFAGRGVSLSFPSLRAETIRQELPPQMAAVRRPGLTLAPEAASDRLRRLINKPISDQDLFAALEAAYRAGFQRVKLYFMVGLPEETEEDVRRIVALASEVAQRKKRLGLGGPAKVKVSVANFVPKPQTPFQWEAMATREALVGKHGLLRALSRRSRGIQVDYHDADVSVLEGVFARGDRRLGGALWAAYRLGCRFEGWSEHFSREKWERAFQEAGLDPAWYAHRRRGEDEFLPWSVVSMGVPEALLRRDRERALVREP